MSNGVMSAEGISASGSKIERTCLHVVLYVDIGIIAEHLHPYLQDHELCCLALLTTIPCIGVL